MGYYDRTFDEWCENTPLVQPCGLHLRQDRINPELCSGWVDGKLVEFAIENALIGALVGALNGGTYIVVDAGDTRRWHLS